MTAKTTAFALMIAAAALVVPSRAFAGAALAQARGASADPSNFDGARARSEKDPVREGALTDPRTPEQIARDEQVKADARVVRRETAPEARIDFAAPAAAPAQGIPRDRLIGGVMGAMCGLLGGGLLAYGLSRLTA